MKTKAISWMQSICGGSRELNGINKRRCIRLRHVTPALSDTASGPFDVRYVSLGAVEPWFAANRSSAATDVLIRNLHGSGRLSADASQPAHPDPGRLESQCLERIPRPVWSGRVRLRAQ